jgi:lipopolysaccharide transport system ATP-binding protein
VKPILEVHHLAKKYKIKHLSGGYLSLRERMLTAFKPGNGKAEDFWAVNDVSFEVQPGESIGIIGRNGAGKSTLLKILSKITPPTKGKIISRGRMASLLEVGTGFHPELTGRENIFFNGSLLGMKRKEIESKFDEIVDFSGVEKFLDTPLKHYSSGMQLRLAFSVAAFLEPEILVIDEVLAVGDAEFQKKCLGKMEDVSKSGRTILFVSHNMAAVRELCPTSILLGKGKIVKHGKSSDIIDTYLRSSVLDNQVYKGDKKKLDPFIEQCFTSTEHEELCSTFKISEDILVNIITENPVGGINISVGIALRDKWGNKIFTTVKHFTDYSTRNHHKIIIPKNLLLSGNFSIDAALFIPNGNVYDYAREVINFHVNDYESEMASYNNSDIGIINIQCKWF